MLICYKNIIFIVKQQKAMGGLFTNVFWSSLIWLHTFALTTTCRGSECRQTWSSDPYSIVYTLFYNHVLRFLLISGFEKLLCVCAWFWCCTIFNDFSLNCGLLYCRKHCINFVRSECKRNRCIAVIPLNIRCAFNMQMLFYETSLLKINAKLIFTGY